MLGTHLYNIIVTLVHNLGLHKQIYPEILVDVILVYSPRFPIHSFTFFTLILTIKYWKHSPWTLVYLVLSYCQRFWYHWSPNISFFFPIFPYLTSCLRWSSSYIYTHIHTHKIKLKKNASTCKQRKKMIVKVLSEILMLQFNHKH